MNANEVMAKAKEWLTGYITMMAANSKIVFSGERTLSSFLQELIVEVTADGGIVQFFVYLVCPPGQTDSWQLRRGGLIVVSQSLMAVYFGLERQELDYAQIELEGNGLQVVPRQELEGTVYVVDGELTLEKPSDPSCASYRFFSSSELVGVVSGYRLRSA